MCYNLFVDIRVNSYLPKTAVEGPGIRFCIWVQGCSIRCVGCANSHMWNKDGGRTVDVKDLISEIHNYKPEIEGITFLGGEPLDQIEAVIEISKAAKAEGLSVLVFTGYDYEKLEDDNKVAELVKYTDILIDGKYEELKQDFSRPWIGSSNQKYYFFSDRYDESIIRQYKNKMEIRIDEKSGIVMNGMGDVEKFKKLVAKL